MRLIPVFFAVIAGSCWPTVGQATGSVAPFPLRLDAVDQVVEMSGPDETTSVRRAPISFGALMPPVAAFAPTTWGLAG